MSTRELAYNIIDQMSEEQLEGLVMLLKGYFPQKNIPNSETLEAFNELDNSGGFVLDTFFMDCRGRVSRPVVHTPHQRGRGNPAPTNRTPKARTPLN